MHDPQQDRIAAMGEAIQRAWRAWVRENVDPDAFRELLREIDWDDADEDYGEPVYLYVIVALDDNGEPYIEDVQGPMTPGFFQGAGRLDRPRLVAAIPLFAGMTRRDLMEFDVAEDTAYWEDPEWS